MNDEGDFEAYLNGVKLNYSRKSKTPVSVRLLAGKNVLAVKVLASRGGPKVKSILTLNGRLLQSAADWKFSLTEDQGWQTPNFNDAAWTPARVANPQQHRNRHAEKDLRGEWATVQEKAADKVEAEFAFFRLTFQVDANTPRGQLAAQIEKDALREVNQRIDEIVVQKVAFAKTPLSEVIKDLNAQLKIASEGKLRLKFAAADELAKIPITHEGTNILLRQLIDILTRQTESQMNPDADGTLRLQKPAP